MPWCHLWETRFTKYWKWFDDIALRRSYIGRQPSCQIASIKFHFFHETCILDILRRQKFDQSHRSDYLNSSTSHESQQRFKWRNLNDINFHKHFSWDSPLGMVNNGDYFFTILFCRRRFLLLAVQTLGLSYSNPPRVLGRCLHSMNVPSMVEWITGGLIRKGVLSMTSSRGTAH